MGGKNKGSGGQTQTSQTTPFLSRQVRETGTEAQRLYNEGRGAPPFAPFSDISNQAFGTAQNLFPGMSQQFQQTMQGDFMGANPYMDRMVGGIKRDVMADVNSVFSQAGRTGGGLHQGALAEALGDVEARIRAPAYETERARMLQAAGAIPGMVQGQLGVGGVMEAKDLEEQLAPYTNLQRYAQIVNMPSGGTTIQTGPGTPGRGALAGAAGGALTGASLGSVIPGIGTGIGAGIGGVLGGFGVI